MRSLVNGDRTPLILEDNAGNWMLAAA